MKSDKVLQFISELVEILIEKDGSDIFITAGCEPAIKIGGAIHRIGDTKLTSEQTDTLVHSVMDERQAQLFAEAHEANFALNLPDVARFRVSAFQQRGSTGMVMRLIKSHVHSFQALSLPPMLSNLALEKRGLILVIGATGSGKSTTLASMIDHRNTQTTDHIVTLEDPIEFFHRHKQGIVNQREIGTDSDNYSVALKNTMRQAPSVILIGEIRDREAMEHAIAFSETGHLVLSTLLANSADQAFDRIVNFFPGDQREQVLLDLSFNLKAMVAQRLVTRCDQNGLVPATEILVNTPLIAEMIFQNRIREIKDTMARSSEQGLTTFNQSLFELYEAGKISFESALKNADSVNDLRLMIKLKSQRAMPAGLSNKMRGVGIARSAHYQRQESRIS